MNLVPRSVLLLATVLPLGSCATFIEYTDGLRDSKNHTVFVRSTGKFGGAIGFIAGIPIDIAALPVTYPLYLYQGSDDSETMDFTSMILFPSFALLQVGSLLAAPVDVLEFAFYRAWLPPDTMTAEEQEELEMRIDDETLPRYPVTPIYPKKK